MSRQMENAQKLYLRGIRDGAVGEVLSIYMGKTYTQHSTGVKDGKVGFAEFSKTSSSATRSARSRSSVLSRMVPSCSCRCTRT